MMGREKGGIVDGAGYNSNKPILGFSHLLALPA